MNYNVLNDKVQINETGEVFIFVTNYKGHRALIARLAKKLRALYEGMGSYFDGEPVRVEENIPVWRIPRNTPIIRFSLHGVSMAMLSTLAHNLLESLNWKGLDHVEVWRSPRVIHPNETFRKIYLAVAHDARMRNPDRQAKLLQELDGKKLTKPENCSVQGSEAKFQLELETLLTPLYRGIKIAVAGRDSGFWRTPDMEEFPVYDVVIRNVPEEILPRVKGWLELNGFWYFSCTDQPQVDGFGLTTIVTKYSGFNG